MNGKLTNIIVQLMKEERNRPIDEQFPFVRTDIEGLERLAREISLASSNLVAKSTKSGSSV